MFHTPRPTTKGALRLSRLPIVFGLLAVLVGCWAGYAPFQGPPETSDSAAAQPPATASATKTSLTISSAPPKSPPSTPRPLATPVAAPPLATPRLSSTPSAPDTATAQGPDLVDAALMAAVKTVPAVQQWVFVPFGQFQRGNRYVVVGWLAFDQNGHIKNDNVVGLSFDLVGVSQYRQVGDAWLVRDHSATPNTLAQTLGGRDYQMLPRGEGLALNQLGPQLARHCQAFSKAYRTGQQAQATGLAVELSRLFSIDQATYTNTAARLLYHCASADSVRHLKTTIRGGRARVRLQLSRGSASHQTQLFAQQSGRGAERWVITSSD